jgi:hypothetical protein
VWLPKSTAAYHEQTMTATMPEWLARQKRLIDAA